MKWRQIQRTNFTKLDDLLNYLAIPSNLRNLFLHSPRFVLNVPRRLAAKMEKGDCQDPLLRQFVPLAEEEVITPGYFADPVCDKEFQKGGKLLHKYHSRALLLATSACAMHCRYCFRQNFPYETKTSAFSQELEYIAQNTSLSEIILSGGDPLSLGDEALGTLLFDLGRIPHLKRIRFHTRFPIGIPERIDDAFLAMLAACPKQIIFVVHVNHPKELDQDVIAALKRVQKLGIPVLNQSVLLKGVNDDEATFLSLCETLISAGIVPYYLHLLDLVQGAAHFAVPDARGHELIQYVQMHLSGFGVPRLVREEAGSLSKTFVYEKEKRKDAETQRRREII